MNVLPIPCSSWCVHDFCLSVARINYRLWMNIMILYAWAFKNVLYWILTDIELIDLIRRLNLVYSACTVLYQLMPAALESSEQGISSAVTCSLFHLLFKFLCLSLLMNCMEYIRFFCSPWNQQFVYAIQLVFEVFLAHCLLRNYCTIFTENTRQQSFRRISVNIRRFRKNTENWRFSNCENFVILRRFSGNSAAGYYP